MSENMTRLLKLKERIEDAGRLQAQYEGRLTTLLDQLKKEYKCATIKATNEELANLRKQKAAVEKQIADGLQTLEDEYDLTEEDSL